MALCFTHTAAGYAVYEAARPAGRHRPLLAAAAVVLANAPDLDFVPGFLVGQPGAFHRGITHTLAGVVLVTAVTWLLARGRARLATTTFVAAAWGSHLVVDFFSTDAIAPHGAQFLWPLSDAYLIAARPLFPEIVIDMHSAGSFLATMLSPATLPVWCWELGTLITVVASVHTVRAIVAILEDAAEGNIPE